MQFNSTVKLLRDVLSRKVYEYFIEKLHNLFVLKIHDGREFSDFSNEVCREIFSRPMKITLVNRLREIQYKLLHGAIFTREHLFRFGFVVYNLCSFCKQKIETYLHLFWECVHVQRLRQNIIAKFELRVIKVYRLDIYSFRVVW